MNNSKDINNYGIANDINAFLNSSLRKAKEKKHHLPRHVCEIIETFSKDDDILDVGCGVGADLNILKDHGFKNIYGIEILPEAVECARTVLGLENIYQGNCEELPFSDNFFDCCTAINVLEHTLYPVKAMSQIRRILRPGGIVYITVPKASSFSDIILRWGGIILHGKSSHIQKFNLKKAKKLFLEHRFSIEEQEKITGFELDNQIFKRNIIFKGIYKVLFFFLKSELNGWYFKLKKIE